MKNLKILRETKFGLYLNHLLDIILLEPSGVFKNKQNENGLVVRNKARLVGQGFTQVEGFGF
jgi:Reverse transcriptase (RNA-dependent DNA polymerase).